MSSKCVSFYILHVNKCGFLVCRLVDAETIPTAISQQDKLKLNHPICTTSAICIIPVQHAHLHSLCISSAIPIIPDQHAFLIQPKRTILDQHALLIQPKCTIPVQHVQHCHTFSATPVQHAQHCHIFSTTLVQHAQLQSKCTPDPHMIIQSNCTTQLRH